MDLTIDEALKKGVEAHQAGQIQEADKLYTAILKAQPKHPDANHNMGILGIQVGQPDQALSFFKIAVEAKPNIEQYWISYISNLVALNRTHEADKVLHQARQQGISSSAIDQLKQKIFPTNKITTIEPENPAEHDWLHLLALYNHGKLEQAFNKTNLMLKEFPNSALIYNMQGAIYSKFKQFDESIESYTRALELQPNWADAYNNMGCVQRQKGDLDDAIKSFTHALKLNIEYAEAYYNLGNAQTEKGDIDSAIDNFQQALKVNPTSFKVCCDLGDRLFQKKHYAEAIENYKKALTIKPDFARAHYGLGRVKKETQDFDGALESYMQAIKINPSSAECHISIGNVLRDKGNLEQALEHYSQAHHLNRDSSEASINTGSLLCSMGEFESAKNKYMRALKIEPNHPEAHRGLGSVNMKMHDFKSAVHNYQNALDIDPHHEQTHAIKIYIEAHLCNWINFETQQHSAPNLGTRDQAVTPFTMLFVEDAPSRHRLRAEAYTKKNFQPNSISLAPRPLFKSAKLRIAYFSADFRIHPLMHLIARMLELHDKNKFEVYAYSFGFNKKDKMRQRVIDTVDKFTDIDTVSDLDAVKLARHDKIDIAIDLTGYTENCRPNIFAHRVAPIQINYLGYPGTMGAEFIDYIVTDKVLVPDEYKHHLSEKVIEMPNSYMVTDNTREISNQIMNRSQQGIPKYAFVFCCFNNAYKISPREFDIWMRLLHKVDGSVLWLRNTNKWSSENLCNEAKKRGIKPSRLLFADPIKLEDHLARHQLANLFLDTFNFCAHSTAIDALWAGLPVITKIGHSFSARVSSSLLTAIDMPELITNSEDEYEQLALELAKNPDRLADIKQRLQRNRLSTPLFNTHQFTKDLERGYQKAHENYLSGSQPTNINVE